MRQMLSAGAANPSQLASSIGMTRGAISKLIERLRGKELASRSSVEGDRRYQTVELTPAGKRLVPVLARLADENDREFFGYLQREELNQLVGVLRNIVRRQGWKNVPVD
jgi:DNA-binding MarR family transcriptional regulator